MSAASDSDTPFQKAVKQVNDFKKQPNNDDLLKLYALYKQATVGDVNIDRPTGYMEFKAKAKWDAWEKKKGISKETAGNQYIAYVDELIPLYAENK